MTRPVSDKPFAESLDLKRSEGRRSLHVISRLKGVLAERVKNAQQLLSFPHLGFREELHHRLIYDVSVGEFQLRLAVKSTCRRSKSA